MSDQELISGGFNIDTRYRSQVKNLRTSESQYEYYQRSKETMKKLIKLHRKTGGTILIVAHAPSLEVLTRHLMNGQPRPEQLADLAARVGYCSMTIVDSGPSSRSWQFRYSLDEQTNWQQQQLQQANNILPRSASVVYQPTPISTNYIVPASTIISQSGYFPQLETYSPHFFI
jgi:broad specificity phosphatase PhoE